jgi:hypothetical protein
MMRDPRGALTHRLIEWKRTLSDLEKGPDVAYQDVLKKFDSIWAVKGLIVTRSNLVVIVLERLDLKSIIVGSPMVVVSCLLLATNFSICDKNNKNKNKTKKPKNTVIDRRVWIFKKWVKFLQFVHKGGR